MSVPSWYSQNQVTAKIYHTDQGLDKILACDLYRLVFIINLTQAKVTWEEETPVEELSESDCFVTMSVVNRLD